MQKKIITPPASSPLLSWDIFMRGYQRKMALAEDYNQLNKISISKNWFDEWDVQTRLFSLGKVIIVTDPSLKIIFASSNIFDMNGYDPAQVKGRHPAMFQGEGSSLETRMVIRTAIKNRQPFDVSILNYKKNASPYLCHIEGYPVFNKKKELSNFIAFESIVVAP